MPRAVPLAAVLALALALAPAGCGGGGEGRGGADAGRPAARARDGAGALGSAPTPACFGAAARDPAAPHCVNRRLARTVVPDPARAPSIRNIHCPVVESYPDMEVCAFGVGPGRAVATVALVGDSHASHWRAAFDVVAHANRWRVLAIEHTSCPLSKAIRNLPDPVRFLRCVRWKREVFRWFPRHPEISAVFTAGLSGGTSVVPTRGRDVFQTAVAGYLRAWRALPRTVRHIVVLRDTPKTRGDIIECVEHAQARGEVAGRACAVPRRRALDPDPLVAAAIRARSRRVRTIDLTSVFCDRRDCYPVIGGVLVTRDETHVTSAFARTLGPLLLRRVDALGLGHLR